LLLRLVERLMPRVGNAVPVLVEVQQEERVIVRLDLDPLDRRLDVLRLAATDARSLMKEIVAEAVQTEIRSALEDELIDVARAAAMLDMSEGALRKAVERGQVPCQRIGNRLRFRRMDLIARNAQPSIRRPPGRNGSKLAG